MKFLDCTLRDGGYYNAWDFSPELISDYLSAMQPAGVDVVELGFRFLKNSGFKGACAFTTDSFLKSLKIPTGLTVGVMINGADLCTDIGMQAAVEKLFPLPASDTPVDLVRIACHYHELQQAFAAADWLTGSGYRVGINLMQIADRGEEEIRDLSKRATESSIEVLYFADSMGSMTPDDTSRIIGLLREHWQGDLGIHTHDNIGLALANTLQGQAKGVSWLDATVTGMGRGPGNARTEELAIEVAALRNATSNLVPLMTLIRKHFASMKEKYGWGTNPYYYLAGKYAIHPTYIQEMLGDARYDEEDILAVISHLRAEGGKKFSVSTLEGARRFYLGEPHGSWCPSEVMRGREVLILGTGPGVAVHRSALEAYIRRTRPLVLALNTQEAIAPELIDLRIACHPVRLLADAERHANLTQPLITPASMLPDSLRVILGCKTLLDFGLGITAGRFEFHENHCVAPTSLVLAYALAAATSGQAKKILMAGFDGYSAGDPRNAETADILEIFSASEARVSLLAITPTVHPVNSVSVYAI